MIAAISLIRRRDDIGISAFRRHWLNVHGPLVCAFPGLLHYEQCHVIQSTAMNDAARAARIDGFPILIFADDAQRRTAHDSPAMAACNEDSKSFIGAVARVMAEPEDIVAIDTTSRMRLIALLAEHASEATITLHIAALQRLTGLRGLRRYSVREQGRAPASAIPHLPVQAAAVLEARFHSLVDLECALDSVDPGGAAHFVVEAHRLP